MPRSTQPPVDPSLLPRHIGVIMDGNGRWAKKRGLPRSAGHAAGAKTFQAICRHANRIGVPYLTFYAFSTENWKRPPEEVAALMDLMRDYLKRVDDFRKDNMVLRFIGDRTALAPDIQAMMAESEEKSRSATGTTVAVAVNYGGQQEIARAAAALARQVQAGALTPEEITPAALAAGLDTADLPEVDLIIRPSGELRLSNFLTWQSAYAELWFSDVLWPDFTSRDLDAAIADFARRQRRFGGL